MKKEDDEQKEIKCHGCGKNEFRLTRVAGDQVLAECIHCKYSHTLNSSLKGKTHSALLWSTTPETTERCIECRSPLKVHDINVQTGHGRAKCEKCGLLYIYKKDRLHGWRIIRVTRRVEGT
jgi:uncharacterized Zn finger protein